MQDITITLRNGEVKTFYCYEEPIEFLTTHIVVQHYEGVEFISYSDIKEMSAA